MRFQVFNKGKIVDKFPLCGAYLFGGDGISLRRANITFDGGMVQCEKPNLDTAGLTLLWPIDGFGKVLLPTTCLPDREKPYNLNVEIARAKLMQIVNKREDWSFFNKVQGLSELSKSAQELFIQAIQNISKPSVASMRADESLNKAIFLAEKLAVRQAESLFQTRSKGHGFGRGCFGCRVDPLKIDNPVYIERLQELFGSVTIDVNWAKIEPQQGEYDFSTIDACIKALGKRRLAFSAGPLLRFTQEYLPEWLRQSDWGFEQIRDSAYHFISEVVSRYDGIVRLWHTISGMNALNYFGFRFEQILEMTRAANIAARQASSKSLKVIEISNPWGEYYATLPNTIPPVVYMDMVVQSGVNFDAFGLQIHLGKNQFGMHVRDMMQISAILDSFAPIAKPLYVTGVAVPGTNGQDLLDGEVAGIWREKWNSSRQAQWIEQFYKISLSKSFVSSVTYSNLVDSPDTTIANSGLLTDRIEPKESFVILRELHNSVFKR